MFYLKRNRIIVSVCLLLGFGLLSLAQPTYDYNIEFRGNPVFDDTSKVNIRFNLLDASSNIRIAPKYDIQDLEISVEDRFVDKPEMNLKVGPRYVQNSFKMNMGPGVRSNTQTSILNPDDITVSVLVDRSGSMTQGKIDKVNEALNDLLGNMPDGSVFISTFSNDIRASLPYSKEDIGKEIVKIHENPTESHTALFNAIYTKLLEFDSAAIIPNTQYELDYARTEQIFRRNTPQNYLIVLTDGKDESEKIEKYYSEDFIRIDKQTLFTAVEASSESVEIWMVGIKEEGDDRFYDEETMKSICEISGKPDAYKRGGEDELKISFKTFIDNAIPDYQLTIKYPPKSRFTGEKRELRIRLTFPDGKKARGSYGFTKGSKASPYIINPPGVYERIIVGLGLGLIFLIVVIIIIQVIVPLSRSIMFKLKNVKQYNPDSDTEKLSCSWCKDEIVDGEKAVFKCEHISHWTCWKENNHQCPNYPDLCEKGKQDFFDINDPFARDDVDSIIKQNKKRFMRWVVSGIIAGLITWLVYELFLHWKLSHAFDGLITSVLPSGISNQLNYIEKFTPLLWVGILLGFFLSLFFLYLEEFRRVNFRIALKLLLRAFIGAGIGFVAFFIGSVILIQFKVYSTNPLDVISWVLFGPLVGYYLSIKTTLSAVHGIIGGLFSILFCFFTLYLVNRAEEYLIVFSFAIYGGGLGMAISTIRQLAEKYFLVLYNAPVKNKEFPLHKWISQSADYGTFNIGRGSKSMIKMDWESKDLVSDDVHAAIYLEKSNKDYPVITIRDTNFKTYLNDHILMRPEKEYLLHNGDTFKIGETVFKYEEKQGE